MALQICRRYLLTSLEQIHGRGWTIYPVFGAWRHQAPQPFTYEKSIIIELLGNKNLERQSGELAVALEERYAQDEVLVYCQEVYRNND